MLASLRAALLLGSKSWGIEKIGRKEEDSSVFSQLMSLRVFIPSPRLLLPGSPWPTAQLTRGLGNLPLLLPLSWPGVLKAPYCGYSSGPSTYFVLPFPSLKGFITDPHWCLFSWVEYDSASCQTLTDLACMCACVFPIERKLVAWFF